MSETNKDPNAGLGGSYRKNKDGSRELIHRTKDAARGKDGKEIAPPAEAPAASSNANVTNLDPGKKK